MTNLESLDRSITRTVKKKHKRGFLQGYYVPKNPQKYTGKVNEIFYRSKWERKFMIWCDLNPSVLKWLSESYPIPYYSEIDNKWHRYFIDFFLEILSKDGTKKRLAIEIKPEVQTRPPKNRKGKKQETYLEEVKTYMINSAKWKAAEEWCKNQGFEFIIMNEYHLGIKKEK